MLFLVDVDYISNSYTKGQSEMILETLACFKFILFIKMLRMFLKHSGKYVLETIVQEFG